MIAKAHIRPVRRVKTKVSKAAKAKRVDAKKERSSIKQARSKPRID
jgi:ribosome-associated protein